VVEKMIGLFLAILVINGIAFYTNKRLTINQMVHIWTFTIAFQMSFDFYMDMEFHAYWYFTKHADWKELPTNFLLVPPANMIFLNFYPFEKSKWKRVIYLLLFVLIILGYEFITTFPEPWGYFHYGWWDLWHSLLLDPILLVMLIFYYKWICRIEKAS
jgi:hypothetical protein